MGVLPHLPNTTLDPTVTGDAATGSVCAPSTRVKISLPRRHQARRCGPGRRTRAARPRPIAVIEGEATQTAVGLGRDSAAQGSGPRPRDLAPSSSERPRASSPSLGLIPGTADRRLVSRTRENAEGGTDGGLPSRGGHRPRRRSQASGSRPARAGRDSNKHGLGGVDSS